MTGVQTCALPIYRAEAEALLSANDAGLSPALASRVFDYLSSERSGLIADCRPDIEGIRVVLELRSRFGEPRRTFDDPERYVDRSYLDRATR